MLITLGAYFLLLGVNASVEDIFTLQGFFWSDFFLLMYQHVREGSNEVPLPDQKKLFVFRSSLPLIFFIFGLSSVLLVSRRRVARAGASAKPSLSAVYLNACLTHCKQDLKENFLFSFSRFFTTELNSTSERARDRPPAVLTGKSNLKLNCRS